MFLSLVKVLIPHLVVHAGGVVHGLHSAPGDAPDVNLLLALGQPRQAPAVVREIRHLVVVRIAAERLQQRSVNIFPYFSAWLIWFYSQNPNTCSNTQKKYVKTPCVLDPSDEIFLFWSWR